MYVQKINPIYRKIIIGASSSQEAGSASAQDSLHRVLSLPDEPIRKGIASILKEAWRKITTSFRAYIAQILVHVGHELELFTMLILHSW